MLAAQSNRAIAAIVVLAWIALAARVQAQPRLPTAHLTWRRPPLSTCPTRAELISDVEQMSDTLRFAARDEAAVLLDGAITVEGEGYRVRISTRSRDGAVLGGRELVRAEPDCAGLRGVLALVLTMLIESAAAHARQDGRALGLSAGLHAGVLSGALPLTAIGAGASLTLRVPPNLRLSAVASAFLPVDVEGSRTLTRLTVWSAGLELCGRLFGDSRAAHGLLCGSAQAGGKHATTEGLRQPSNVVRLLALGQLELMAVLPLSPHIAITAAAGIALFWTRPNFYYRRADDSKQDVHRSPPLGGVARLGLTYDLF